MRSLASIILVLVSLLHTWLLASSWPRPLIAITPVAADSEGAPLLQAVLAFVLACSVVMLLSLVFSRRFLAALGVLAIVVLSASGYLYLPLPKVFMPSAAEWMASLIGVILAGVLCLRWYERGTGTDLPFLRFSTLSAFCVIYNILLVVAPSSVVFPTGYAGSVSWAHDTLVLRHEDSVSIHNNLLFIIIRTVLDPIVGSSIVANSLVSTVMVSLGLALMVVGLQIAAGPVVALCAMLLMVSERWAIVTAFAGNLPASLVTTSGLLFYVLMRIGFGGGDRSRGWHFRTFGLLVVATLLSLYSYAAVRMPFMLSVCFMALVYAVRTEGPFRKKILGALLWIVAPVVCGFSLMAIGPYKGSFLGLKHDLLVSWPKDSVIAHPGSQGLGNYQAIRNFDTPLWQQIARPIDGSNRSVIWTKTPLETLAAFRDHVVEVANNNHDFFFLQPLPLFLVELGLCSLFLVSQRSRALFVVVFVWSLLWLSTFLLVPDPSAFRRAVAFPGAFVVVAALVAVPFVRSRSSAWLTVLLCVVVVVVRLPYELAMANKSEARMRMFTLCATAPAHRALLTSPLMSDKKWPQLYVLPDGINGGKEGMCFDTVIRSPEWQRIAPPTTVINVAPEQGLAELEKLPAGALVIAYCNGDSKRANHVNVLCTSGTPKLRSLGTIENSYDGAHWVVFQTTS